MVRRTARFFSQSVPLILPSTNSHAELGAASPYFVAPGAQWTDAEIKTQAELLVGYKALNVGAICASPQVRFKWIAEPNVHFVQFSRSSSP